MSRNRNGSVTTAILAATLFLWTGAAVADDGALDDGIAQLGETVSAGDLRGLAAREDVNHSTVAALNSDFTNNTIGDNVQSGFAAIQGNAFQNMQGIAGIVINSGHNVSINNNMIVNLTLN